MVEIVQAASPAHIARIRALFLEYAQWLNIDLCFQGFQAELDSLPGRYAPPGGELLIAVEGDQAAGCVGVRSLDDGLCEMKRLYVRPAWRGTGLGRRLATAAIQAGRLSGARGMRLDTLHRMIEANRLYDALGFRDIPAYYSNPHDGVRYLELRY